MVNGCFWTPSYGTACGIAEYTKDLVHEMKVPVFTEQPPLGEFDVVHIQHEAGIFPDQAGLSQSITDLQSRGARVIVTEHTVSDYPRRYEIVCDGLIALSPRGAGAFTERWSNRKSIAYLVLGCPTFFPERKKVKGKTIGVFGFLEPYKGFWDIANAIRNTDINMVMYSHSRSPKFREHWDEHVKGMTNIVRHDKFYPLETVVKKLAKEVDALVFWHYAPPVYSASSSVRVGMSTGVPILARAGSRWFNHLEDSVYLSQDLYSGIQTILHNDDLREMVSKNAIKYCNKYSWKNSAETHFKLWEGILEER